MQVWRAHAACNFEHLHELMLAERCRVEGRGDAAMRHYDAAIAAARSGGFVHDQALAASCAASFYGERGSSTVADVYLREARYCHQLWGASAVVAALDRRHPQLVRDTPLLVQSSIQVATTSNGLDLFAVVRASQAISSELQLSGVLRAVMRSVAESAGAERALLLLVGRHGELAIEAVHPEGGVALPQELNASDIVPRQVVQFVARTRTIVLLGDAAESGDFVADPCIAARRPRSLLCLPIVRQGQLTGLLYLENGLARDVFTAERLRVLELLAAQAAVSIENARLYDELEQRVQERTRELKAAQMRLAEVARQAGMAEVATNILHNVGNLLNSVNTSGNLLRRGLDAMSFERLARLGSLLAEQGESLPAFMAGDKGRRIPEFIAGLAEVHAGERQQLRDALERMLAHVERIEVIITRQQDHVSKARVVKVVDLVGEIEETLGLYVYELERHDISVERQYEARPRVLLEQHKLQQILVNLVSNAKRALLDVPQPRRLWVRVRQVDADRIQVEVADNGVGIAPEARTRIFQHGFTTRKDGHGFGLHYCANAATEMGGDLVAESEGVGKGARFVLTLPVPRERVADEAVGSVVAVSS
jgi:signal transduction histidine kinase